VDKLTVALSSFGWTGFVCAVSYALSKGFTLPPQMEHFQFFALLGALVGFGFTNIFFSRSTRPGFQLLACLVIGWGATASYSLLIQNGSTAGTFLYLTLGFLLTVAFACFGVALRTAGLTAEKTGSDAEKV
jgi:hypothetical protein